MENVSLSCALTVLKLDLTEFASLNVARMNYILMKMESVNASKTTI